MSHCRNKLLATGLTATIALNIQAADQAAVWKDQQPSRLKEERHQLAVGIDFRVDKTKYIDAQPQLSAQFMKFVSNQVAWKIALGYCVNTQLAANSEAQTLSIGVGVKVQQPMKLYSPFLDLTLIQERYSGNLGARDFSQRKSGLAVGVGLSLRVDPDSRFDFGVQHLINSPGGRPVFLPEQSLPPENQYGPPWMGGGGLNVYDLYNPTHLYVHYRFAL